MQQVTFKNTGPFRSALKKKIDEYFDTNGISKKGNWNLYSKTIILFAMLTSVYLMILFSPTVWSLALLYPLLGLIVSTIGFNVMHDASHGSYSNNKKLNKFIAFIGGDLMGGSVFMWNIKHNVLHHTYTNIEGFDDDIAKYPIFRLNEYQKRLWFHKYQFLYAPILYAFTTINWTFFDDYLKVATKKIHPKKFHMTKKDHMTFWLGKVLNIGLFLVLPIFIIGFWQALIGFLLMHAALGLSLAFVFQMAHVVGETTFHEPDKGNFEEWMIHQIKTTANFAMKNKLISWLVGGLNYQVEHHLFSGISHVHYPAISSIVQDTCKEQQITYNAFPTFRKAIASHFAYLYAMGRR